MRYFLIDKVTEVVAGERARGVKCVTLTDETLHDHFPDHPILPGALILEGCSQLGGFLLEVTLNRPEEPLARAVLMQVRQAKFYEICGPGDRLDLVAQIESARSTAAEVRVEATCDGKRVMRGQLTFVMKQIDSPRVHEQRRNLYRLWTRGLAEPPTIL